MKIPEQVAPMRRPGRARHQIPSPERERMALDNEPEIEGVTGLSWLEALRS